MIEIRLCSIELSRVVAQIGDGKQVENTVMNVGRMFSAVVARKSGEPLDGAMAVAERGVRFDSADFLKSLIHVFGIVAAATGVESTEADRLAGFVGGDSVYGNVPVPLKKVGVYSAMGKSDVQRAASWLQKLDRQVFREEVQSMFGAQAVATYEAAARDLQRLLQSVTTHDADLCCVRPE